MADAGSVGGLAAGGGGRRGDSFAERAGAAAGGARYEEEEFSVSAAGGGGAGGSAGGGAGGSGAGAVRWEASAGADFSDVGAAAADAHAAEAAAEAAWASGAVGGGARGGAARWSVPASAVPELEDRDGDGDVDEDDLDHELPDFASKENRELNEQIKRIERSIMATAQDASLHADRVRIIKEHLKNVQAELEHTQRLLEAKTKETQTEDHMKQLAEREIGRIRQELKALESKAEDVADQLSSAQADIHRGRDRLDAFTREMEINQDELKQWSVARKQKDEDVLALVKYTRADDAKIKELGLALERLTVAVNDKRRALDAAITETQSKQIELDKTAEDFRNMHAERQSMLVRLQESVDTIARRDVELQEISVKYAESREALAERQGRIRELVASQERQIRENKELEVRMEESGRQLAKRRERLTAAQADLRALEDEVELQKSELGKAASELTKFRGELAHFEAQKEEGRRLIELSRAKLATVRREREEAESSAERLEKAAEKREQDLKGEEERLVALERELELLKEKMFRSSEELSFLRRQESELAAEISGAQAASRNLSLSIHKLDTEAARQAELVYNAEFQIQAMERKLARVKGEVSDEEKKRLEARIAELNTELERTRELESDLRQQLRRMGDDMRRVQRRQRDLEEELSVVRAAIAELELQTRTGEMQLQGAIREREEAQVAHDVVKLEVRRLRATLSTKSDEVFGLENRAAQLALSMAERRQEIDVHLKLQRAQAKLVEEERHQVAMDLREREARVEALRRKYEALCARLRGSTDEAAGAAGGEKSQAYFVIKAAQRREELQRAGDELNASVIQTEREVRALTQTLEQLKVRNTVYRESFRKADPGSTDVEALRALESHAKELTDAVFRKKRELQKLSADSDAGEGRVRDIFAQSETLRNHVAQLREAAEALQRERDAQEADQRRVLESLARARAESRRAAGGHIHDAEPSLEEEAVRAEALRDNNHSVLFTLGQLAREFPQLQPALHAAAAEHGMKIPTRPVDRARASRATAPAADAAGSSGAGGGGGGSRATAAAAAASTMSSTSAAGRSVPVSRTAAASPSPRTASGAGATGRVAAGGGGSGGGSGGLSITGMGRGSSAAVPLSVSPMRSVGSVGGGPSPAARGGGSRGPSPRVR